MKKNLTIINNEKCLDKEGNFFCENIEISSITELLSKTFNIKLILRKSDINPIFKINNKNVTACSNIFFFIAKVIQSVIRDNSNYLIISVTPYTFISFIILLLSRRKIFLYLRSDGKKEISVIFGKKISKVYKFVENIMSKFSNLIVVSDLISKKENFSLVNPSQIDQEWYQDIVKSERNKLKLLYVGRLKIEKGVYSLLDIFNQIKEQEKEISLTLIGQGSIGKYVNKRIRLINPTSKKKDLIKYYDSHDIFILPSFTEGHPQVLIESLIRQRPVIVFEEIKHVSKKYEGVFVIKRNSEELFNIIKYIDKNYNEIIEKMKKNKYPTKENFLNQLVSILNTN